MFGAVLSRSLQEIIIIDLIHRNKQVYSVKKWTREFLLVVLNLGLGAFAFMRWIAEIAARARIHCRNHHEVRRINSFLIGSRDGNCFIFKRLA